jgi:adenylosuccinate synthase
MIKGKANIVMDGQWGSTGKGKLVGYLATNHDINAAVCDFMSNAGHTFESDTGEKLITCQLPMAFVNTDCVLMINPGAAITIERFEKELEMFADYKIADRLMIHPHVAIIEEEDKEYEREVLSRISSTLKGCGGSMARKIMRVASLAKDEPKLKSYITDTSKITHSILQAGGTIMVEGAQGFDLSLNHGHYYPYVTSRDVTTMSILNNAGIPPCWLGDVYGSLRTFPIRVGNTYDDNGKQVGWSGPIYDDQKEITFEDLEKMSNSNECLIERTTVTKKIRRLFTFSEKQLDRFVDFCAPTKLFVNFINHINANDINKRAYVELSDKSKMFINNIEKHLNKKFTESRLIAPKITHIGTGAKNNSMITL